MERAKIYKSVDTNYKGGFVECKCGYHKDFGDGFNQYHIENCPECTPELKTRTQETVQYWDKDRRMMRVDKGENIYFVIDNGINVRYKAENIVTSYKNSVR